MKYSELPQEYKQLADKMREHYSHKRYDNLRGRFDWVSSNEGFNFWKKVCDAKSPEELPLLEAPKYWAIELDGEEIREEVSTIDDLSLDTDYNYFVYHYSNYVFYEEMPPLKYLIITHEEWRRLIKPTLEKPIEQRVDEVPDECLVLQDDHLGLPEEHSSLARVGAAKPNKSDFYYLDKDAYIKALEDYRDLI